MSLDMMGSGPLFCSVIFFHQADNLDDVVLDDCWCALSLCGGVLSDRGGVLSDRGGVLSDRGGVLSGWLLGR